MWVSSVPCSFEYYTTKMVSVDSATDHCSSLNMFLFSVAVETCVLSCCRAVACAANFHGVGFIQWRVVVICIWCAMLFGVTIWRHIHVYKQSFGEVCWHNMHIITHTLPYFMCHFTEYKLSALQVRISEENKLNAATQQLVTAKISGCALKQGSKTHSSLRPNNLQLQN